MFGTDMIVPNVAMLDMAVSFHLVSRNASATFVNYMLYFEVPGVQNSKSGEKHADKFATNMLVKDMLATMCATDMLATI